MKPITKSTILQTLARHRSELRSYGVRQIGLLGSFVRSEENPHLSASAAFQSQFTKFSQIS